MTIVATYPPRRLFRYRSISKNPVSYIEPNGLTFWDRELTALNEGYLWFANFKSMNDPMEGSYEASTRVKRLTRYDDIKAKIYYDKISLGICSFSETNNNGPMWAHYADEFRGICIEYSLGPFSKLLAQHKARFNTLMNLVRVTYSEDRYRLSRAATDDDDVAQQILSFKSHRWLHEREWRLFKKGAGKFSLSQNCVSHIYFGNRMNPNDIGKFKSGLRLKDIPVSRMKLKGYSIEFDRLKAADK